MSKEMSSAVPSKRKIWRRRVVGSLVTCGVIAGASIATAAYIGRAGIDGGGQGGTMVAKWTDTSTPTGVGDLAPSVNGGINGGPITLPQGLVFLPGESYGWSGKVSLRMGSVSEGWVSGVSMPGLPKGYTATLDQGCLWQLDGSNPVGSVKVKITRSEDSTNDSAWTLKDGAGVLVTAGEKPRGATCQSTYAGTD